MWKAGKLLLRAWFRVSDEKSVTLRTHPFFPWSKLKLGLNPAAGKLLYSPDKPHGSYQLRSNLPKVLSLTVLTQFSRCHHNSPRLATSTELQFSFCLRSLKRPHLSQEHTIACGFGWCCVVQQIKDEWPSVTEALYLPEARQDWKVKNNLTENILVQKIKSKYVAHWLAKYVLIYNLFILFNLFLIGC